MTIENLTIKAINCFKKHKKPSMELRNIVSLEADSKGKRYTYLLTEITYVDTPKNSYQTVKVRVTPKTEEIEEFID